MPLGRRAEPSFYFIHLFALKPSVLNVVVEYESWTYHCSTVFARLGLVG